MTADVRAVLTVHSILLVQKATQGNLVNLFRTDKVIGFSRNRRYLTTNKFKTSEEDIQLVLTETAYNFLRTTMALVNTSEEGIKSRQ